MKALSITVTLSIFLFAINGCNTKKSSDAQADTAIQITVPTLTEVWATDTLLKTPESVIYDETNMVYYVSNVNMNPWEKDENGSISKVSKAGEILAVDWVTGFSGPKGMGIWGDTLFVADLNELALVSISNGSVIEKIAIDGASGLNDITVSNDGVVYISDSNEGKIFQYANGQVSVFHPDVPGRPNGLLAEDGRLLLAFSQASNLVSIDLTTHEISVLTDSIGAGDGITSTHIAGSHLVSDWNGEVFFIDNNGNKTSLLNTKELKKNTADIWFVPAEQLVLVPTFFGNRVVAYKLQ